MKLETKNYEIEIKVNGKGTHKLSESVDTRYFINKISLAFDTAAKKFEDQKMPSTADEFREIAKAMYEYLKGLGFYN